jgi:hypothetical protein
MILTALDEFVGDVFAPRQNQMTAIREPGLRLVQPSRESVTAPSVGAQNATNPVEDKTASVESSAPAHDKHSAAEVDGAIRKHPAAHTLAGVLPAAAKVGHLHPSFAGTQLFVTPATVSAIAKAKRERAEDTHPHDLRELDGARLLVHEGFPAKQCTLDIVEPAPIVIPPAARDRSQQRPVVEAPAAQQPPTAQEKWKAFDTIGLAPKPITKHAQRLLISMYRLLGFGILTVIVVVLLGYIGTTAFYFLNRSWVTPVAISPNDEKVVALQGQLAAQLNVRAQLVGELEQSERALKAEQAFQLQFARAIKKDLEARRRALGRVKQLAYAAAATRDEIRAAGDEFSSSSASKMEQDYKARLVDFDQVLAGKFQLAQITSAKLSLAERQADFDQRAAELAAQTGSLDAILEDKTLTSALSYDVLKIARDYEASKLAYAKELDNRKRLTESIARQDQIIDGINQSAYLRALADGAAVALVPYDNLANVGKDTPLYACRFQMVLCRSVGKVREVLPGEVQVKHPTRDNILRGRMVVMEMTEQEAAQREVLFVGGRPLGI